MKIIEKRRNIVVHDYRDCIDEYYYDYRKDGIMFGCMNINRYIIGSRFGINLSKRYVIRE
jgi:hypothetical protein